MPDDAPEAEREAARLAAELGDRDAAKIIRAAQRAAARGVARPDVVRALDRAHEPGTPRSDSDGSPSEFRTS